MKIIVAYLLAVLGGNQSPSAADLKQILGSGSQVMKDKVLKQKKGSKSMIEA
ncbi:ribosomal protein [Medicago truncatula]|uniref:Ribosomal protein n=1 Tax=Medicago truncatula TaxID=3880 RepID=A0A072VB18_MEDTR|nr:ribosomal protein [Medicago truncatula]